MASVSALARVSEPNPVENDTSELRALIERLATSEGTVESGVPGLRFARISRASTVSSKCHVLGPTLTIVAQGRKLSTYRGVRLAYGPSRYLVVTGEAELEGYVSEASRERPCLAMYYQIPPDIVARTLLTFADARAPRITESVPAYVADLDAPIVDCVMRLLRAIEDPLERKIVAPLASEELVFRLLRADAAAAVRSAVDHDQDAAKISLAMQFLRRNLSKRVTVEDVARHVAMSASHFAHRFRAVARVSPMRYLKGVRLDHARALMISEGLRVGEAAARSGYESPSHFTRDFKAFYGSSPAEYVRQFRDGE